METQKTQIISGELSYESNDVKHITIPRILFHKDYTKIDFGFDSSKIKYIKEKKILISTDLSLQTANDIYKLTAIQIFEKPFFKKDSDYKYFSLLFEAVDENINEIKIIDKYINKSKLPFGFESISLEI